MTQKSGAGYRKKLIEVALPLEAINKESAREKSIRHGHPSTLHLWWARRPLAACRAVLFASLVTDPDDDPMYGVDEEIAGLERAKLFDLIEELVKWENSNNPDVINRARQEIARSMAAEMVADEKLKNDAPLVADAPKLPDEETECLPVDPAEYTPHQLKHKLAKPAQVNHFLIHYAPPILDPFAGGGSIPLEAQRLGLRAHASDLNPVPVLINKALIEIPPKYSGLPPVNPEQSSRLVSDVAFHGAQGLAEDVRYYGQWMRDEAEKRIGNLYPKVKITAEMVQERPDLEQYKDQELTVIAWLWARTVPSPNPACGGAHVPLVRSFWLCKKKGKEAYVQPVVNQENNSYRFEVKVGKPEDGFDPNKGTVVRTGATCLLSENPLPFDNVREAGKAGQMEAKLMAVVCEGNRGRVYISPNEFHESIAREANPKGYPDSPIPKQALGFRVQLYGMDKHHKLFTSRQLVALTTFSDLVQEARERVLCDARIANGECEQREPPSVKASVPASTTRGSLQRDVQLTTYHITFGTYGMRLHGDDRPTVHHDRDKPGEPFEEANPGRVQYLRDKMTHDPVTLTKQQRLYIEQTIPALCEKGGWQLHEVAAQADHVHVLLSAQAEAKKVRKWLKTWLTQALNEQWEKPKWWAKGGSCKHVFDDDYFHTAKQYVAKQTTRAALCESENTHNAKENSASTAHGSNNDNNSKMQHPDYPNRKFNSEQYANAVATYLAFGVSRLANRGSTISFWDQVREGVQQDFARQAIPMTWDFCEGNPFSKSSGNFIGQMKYPILCIEKAQTVPASSVSQNDAIEDKTYSSEIIATDPPYYDNIGYADLSDFFYVWLRKSLSDVYPELFSTLLTPKSAELIATPYRHDGDKKKAATFFEEGLGSTIGQWRNHGNNNYPTTIFYAFKQAETDSRGTSSTGWETFLTGVIEHGYAITGTWPMRTELIGNLKKNVSALASSIVLVCRPRNENAERVSRRDFRSALKDELPDALRNLQRGNIAPVDLAQAAIGPGMSVFSRYAEVLEQDGSPMTVRTALTIINELLDEVLSEQEGEFDTDTRFAIKWFEQYAHNEGPFGDANTLANALAIGMNGLEEAGILVAKSGKVQLIPREELPKDWDPATDSRMTVWECVQQLIYKLEEEGETATAELLNEIVAVKGTEFGDTVRDLAYRLYNTCERKGWSTEARSYNALVISWSEIVRLARDLKNQQPQPKQQEMFE